MTSGWIIFTYENDIPVCLWASTQECKKLPCIVDERICGDTFLRVEKLSDLEYVVADIWLYNSNCVFACSTFKQRYEWLKVFLKTFTSFIEGVTIELIHKSDLEPGYFLKGYEDHPLNEIGKHGYYSDKDDSQLFTIQKLSIPDCYEIVGKNAYLKVPDLKTSKYLRLKGQTFSCKCIPCEDEFWDVAENIPEVEVNAS